MGKTFRRSDDEWDDEVVEVRHARKANKFKRKERHRTDTIFEMNERREEDDDRVRNDT